MKKILILLSIALLSGCAAPRHIPTGSEIEFQDATTSLKEKKYSEAAALCKKIVEEANDPDLVAEARFELALMHTLHDNPQRDYARAMREFEEFLKLHPDSRRAPDAQSWIAVLKTVHDLKKENERLSLSIEQLKRLDIRHEERRRQ